MTTADAKMNSNHQISKETVNDLLCGIHLAASVEGMYFCHKLGGIESKLMYEIIVKAVAFVKANLHKLHLSRATYTAAVDTSHVVYQTWLADFEENKANFDALAEEMLQQLADVATVYTTLVGRGEVCGDEFWARCFYKSELLLPSECVNSSRSFWTQPWAWAKKSMRELRG